MSSLSNSWNRSPNHLFHISLGTVSNPLWLRRTTISTIESHPVRTPPSQLGFRLYLPCRLLLNKQELACILVFFFFGFLLFKKKVNYIHRSFSTHATWWGLTRWKAMSPGNVLKCVCVCVCSVTVQPYVSVGSLSPAWLTGEQKRVHRRV